MPLYQSSQAVLSGTPQTFQPTGFRWGYVEIHNLGGAPMTTTFAGANYPLPAGGRLAFDLDRLSIATSPLNGVTVDGTGTVYVYFASSAPPVPILTQNALGGGSGDVYTVDNVTLQEAIPNQFSIKPLGVGPTQLANDAVTPPKIGPNVLGGWMVGGAINVSPPQGQMWVISWSGSPAPGDTFELTVSYGMNGTTVAQEWIYDAVPGPGQIAITSTGNPSQDMAIAIASWAAGLPVGTTIACDLSGTGFLWLSYMDESSISVDSSGMQWTGSTPTNCTLELQPTYSNQLPISQPLAVIYRPVTSAEAAANMVTIAPGTQPIFVGPPIVQVWRPISPTQYAPSPDPIVAINSIASGERWTIQSSDFDVLDIVVAVFGGLGNPAITPNPYP